jgi:hypothetical protein
MRFKFYIFIILYLSLYICYVLHLFITIFLIGIFVIPIIDLLFQIFFKLSSSQYVFMA